VSRALLIKDGIRLIHTDRPANRIPNNPAMRDAHIIARAKISEHVSRLGYLTLHFVFFFEQRVA
jgi:hypothetical protein